MKFSELDIDGRYIMKMFGDEYKVTVTGFNKKKSRLGHNHMLVEAVSDCGRKFELPSSFFHPWPQDDDARDS